MKQRVRKVTIVTSLALACTSFASNAYCESRLEQRKSLSEASSRLLASKLNQASDAAVRAVTVGMLMELFAKVAHLGDLEELMSVVAEPVTQDMLKRKLEYLRRYEFGHSCAIELNNLSAYVLAVRDSELSARLHATKTLVTSICATAETR